MRAFVFIGLGLIALSSACAPLTKRTHYTRWSEEMARIHAEEAAEEAAAGKAKTGVGIGIGGGGIGIGVQTGTSTGSSAPPPGGTPSIPSRVIRPAPPPPPPPDDAVY